MFTAYSHSSTPLSLFQSISDSQDAGNSQCMYFRLSEDVLAALLESTTSSSMEIVFGETVLFSTGTKSFALTVQEESGTTELYRHSDTESNRLDLAGGVSHKLSVSREVDYKEYLRMHSKRGEMSKVRTESGKPAVIYAEGSDPSHPTKPKFLSSQRPQAVAITNGKPRPSLDKNHPKSKTSAAPVSNSIVPPLRSQVVHLLALKPVREDYIVEKTQPSSPRAVRSILNEIGDRLENDVWGLKDQYWFEVKSQKWPNYTQSQRTEVTNRANAILERLRLSDNSSSRNPATQLMDHSSVQPATPPLTAEHSTAASSNGASISPDLPIIPKKTGGGIFTGRKTTMKKRKAEEDNFSKPKKPRIEGEKGTQKAPARKENTKTADMKIKSAEYVIDSDAESTVDQDAYSDRSRSGSLIPKKKPARTRMEMKSSDPTNSTKSSQRVAPVCPPSDDSPVSVSEQSSASYTTTELNEMARQYRLLFPEYQKLHNRVTALTRTDAKDSGVDVEKLLRKLLKMHDQLRGWKDILVRASKGLDL